MHAPTVPTFNWHHSKHKKRKYNLLPWIVDPTNGAHEDALVFAQRGEADSIELFFDLFFVANLATFTQYHSITDHIGFLSYIEFFGLLWGTWFAVTLHDVRFAVDSMYERTCKIIQLAIFVMFALVGSKFEPGGESEGDENFVFRLLCYVLLVSRLQLITQYAVVLYFCCRAGLKELILPLGMTIFWYVVTTITYGVMTLAFHDGDNMRHVYLVWYGAMFLEIVLVLSVSTYWRQLSFKTTHIVERMGLLTLIVIGEGVIGITKTTTTILRKGPDAEYLTLIFVILLILVWLYLMYFDNTPVSHFGTIKQQLWAWFHFPLHLAIIGIVEGAQQLVRARYVFRNDMYMHDSIVKYCFVERYDGQELQDHLSDMVDYFDFSYKSISERYLPAIEAALYRIGNETGVCTDFVADQNEFNFTNQYPGAIEDLWQNSASAIWAQTLSDYQVPDFDTPLITALDSWAVAFYYFWAALALLAFTSLVMHAMSRRSGLDSFDIAMFAVRIIVIAVAGGIGIAGATNEGFYVRWMSTPSNVPVAMICLFVIIFVDALGRWGSNCQLKDEIPDKFVDDSVANLHHHNGEPCEKHHGDEDDEDYDSRSVRWQSASGISTPNRAGGESIYHRSRSRADSSAPMIPEIAIDRESLRGRRMANSPHGSRSPSRSMSRSMSHDSEMRDSPSRPSSRTEQYRGISSDRYTGPSRRGPTSRFRERAKSRERSQSRVERLAEDRVRRGRIERRLTEQDEE